MNHPLVPPQDLDAERALLGAMMLSADAIADVLAVIRTRDFYAPPHQQVFDVIVTLYSAGQPVDAITVADALTRSQTLATIGGGAYLHTLIGSVGSTASASYYAKIVAEKAVKRRLVEAGTRITQIGYGPAEGSDALAVAEQALTAVTDTRAGAEAVRLEDLLQPVMDDIETASQRGGVMTGLPTGFTDLDRLTNGLHPGQLIVIAGRPGLGKSTLGLDIARACAVHADIAVCVYSLEMSQMEITSRVLSAETRVPLHHLRTGTMGEEDWLKLARRMGQISEAPLFVDDSAHATFADIRSKARRLAHRHDIKLIVVDYLQLMSSTRRTESRQQEVSDLSRGLKLLAKELGIPIIAISQLNRGPEQRTDKRPQLSDLRESGAIEQDADLVILVHREDYYDKDSARAGEADFIIAKHRNGPTDTITVAFQGHYARFVDLATTYH